MKGPLPSCLPQNTAKYRKLPQTTNEIPIRKKPRTANKAKKKSFFSKCTLNFLTKFVVTSKLKYFFLADRYYALRGYNTWPLAPKRYIITNQAPLFSLMLCNFRKNKYLFNINKYRTRAIISRGLYIFYPIFIDYFFVFKKVY